MKKYGFAVMFMILFCLMSTTAFAGLYAGQTSGEYLSRTGTMIEQGNALHYLETERDNNRLFYRKKIGIITALPGEFELLDKALENRAVNTASGTEYHFGKAGNYDVVIVQCGTEQNIVAAGVQAMINVFHPDCIISTGRAAALTPKLKNGGVFIAERIAERAPDTAGVSSGGSAALPAMIEMTADKELADKLCAVFCGKETVVRGLIVSAGQSVEMDEERQQILTAFPDALCTEMAGAAIAHVCEQNKLPFCVVRYIADNADSGVNAADSSKTAGQESAEWLIKFLSN